MSAARERFQAAVRNGHWTRRDVLKRATALGLSAPVITGLLSACGGDDAGETPDPEPTSAGNVAATATSVPLASQATPEPQTAETSTQQAAAETLTQQPAATEPPAPQRGGGGKLRLLNWQAPTILNPHLAFGDKDQHPTLLCNEAFYDWDENDEADLRLATEWPTIENGLLDSDGMWVIWKLREGVTWHDGEEFNADDVKFTWEYAIDPDAATASAAVFEVIEDVEIVNNFTVKLHFRAPNPSWFEPFQGYRSVLPEHILRDYMGVDAIHADFNLKPIGTGPYTVIDFKPGDVILYGINENYWEPGKPFFDEIEWKGGGDAASAARAVLVSDEADFAFNLQVESVLLEQMEADGGIAQIVIQPGRTTERLLINHADPNTEVNGAYAEPTTRHPIFQHRAARQALNLAVQRDVIAEQFYGVAGTATGDLVNVPARFKLDWPWEYDLEQARAKLSEIDFPNAFDNTRLLYQTTVNSVRQKTQEVIKADLDQLGFEVELKAIDSSVFFSTDAGNPDTYNKFYADLEEFSDGPESPYPIEFTRAWHSADIPRQSNGWLGTNRVRWSNSEYDRLHDLAAATLDEREQLEIWQQMLTLVQEDAVEVPLIWRSNAAGINNRIKNWKISRFGSIFNDIKNWTT